MKNSLFIFCFLFPVIYHSQDSVAHNKKKIDFSAQAGIYYKTFFDSRYIKPTPYNYNNHKTFETHQYEGFNKISTFGLNIGSLCSYDFSKHFGIATGLAYFLRRDLFERSQDNTVKYYFSSNRNINNVSIFNYTYHDIELPIMFNYSTNKLHFSVGAYIPLIAYKVAKYTYVVADTYYNSPVLTWHTSTKTVSGFEAPIKASPNGNVWQLHNTGKGYSSYDVLLRIYPTLQASYDVEIKNLHLRPYVAFSYAVQNQNDFYIQAGVCVPLSKKLF